MLNYRETYLARNQQALDALRPQLTQPALDAARAMSTLSPSGSQSTSASEAAAQQPTPSQSEPE